MPHTYLPIERLTVADRDLALANGTLAVSRDDPEPGMTGLRAWHFGVTLAQADWSLTPEAYDVVLVTPTGTHTGQAILNRTDGTGPLAPWPGP
jgi:hypothetical protein